MSTQLWLSREVVAAVRELSDWNEVASAGGFYSSAEWMQQCELPASRYLVVRDRDVIMGVMPCTIETGHGRTLPTYTDPYWLLGRSDPPAPSLADHLYPLISCGTMRGYTNRLLVRPGLSPERRELVLRSLLAGLGELAAHENAKLISFAYLPVPDLLELRTLEPRLVPTFAESEAVLETITTFDDYVARRRFVAREVRAFASAGVRLEICRLGEVSEQYAVLVAVQESKFGTPVASATIRADHARLLDAGLDPQTHVFCGYLDDALVAGALCVQVGRRLYAREYGVAANAPKQAALYFNLLFYQPIRVADGVDSIHYGIGSLQGKVRRGCSLSPLWFGLLPAGAFADELRADLRQASQRRLGAEATLLRQYHDEATVSTQLRLIEGTELLAS